MVNKKLNKEEIDNFLNVESKTYLDWKDHTNFTNITFNKSLSEKAKNRFANDYFTWLDTGKLPSKPDNIEEELLQIDLSTIIIKYIGTTAILYDINKNDYIFKLIKQNQTTVLSDEYEFMRQYI